MSLPRLVIAGLLTMAACYVVAAAIAALVPYVMGAFVIVMCFVGLQRWLSKKDESTRIE